MNILKINNLSIYYGDNKALNNINMEIEENKVIALIGASGCGKSTFLRSINKMNDFIEDSKSEGIIEFRGKDISNINVLELRKYIGMVFQKPNPFPMSIYDNIAFGLRINGIKDKRIIDEIVRKSLIKVGLYEEVRMRLKSFALNLSGGQQQRLCIARAIAIEPDIILMDEPTSALDPISTEIIEKLIIEIKNEFTVVIVTHNMAQAKRISDFTAHFSMGDIIEYDITKNVIGDNFLEKIKRKQG